MLLGWRALEVARKYPGTRIRRSTWNDRCFYFVKNNLFNEKHVVHTDEYLICNFSETDWEIL